MPWVVGIDEAGYGPNLGPLVMSAVALRVPSEHAESDLWQVLDRAVRRRSDAVDERLIIDDSKLVYSSTRGLRDLETSVLACRGGQLPETLTQLLTHLAPDALEELSRDPWFTGTTALPTAAAASQVCAAGDLFDQVCDSQRIGRGRWSSLVIGPAPFNLILDRTDSKSAVLSHSLAILLRQQLEVSDTEPIAVFVDKHGGRNTYAAVLQQALGRGMVVAQEEGRDLSRYRIVGLPQELTVSFQPRADSAHLCVALASMASKYLRELIMHEFNHFWTQQIPGLTPTAGYPLDAKRFLDEIRPHLGRLGIPDARLWRRK